MATVRYITINGNERQPLLDQSRRMLAQGYDPGTVLEVWRPGATEWCMRAPIGVAARYTVVEPANGKEAPHFETYRPGPAARAATLPAAEG